MNSWEITIIFGLGLFALFVVFAYAGAQAQAKAWGELAGRTGLALGPANWFFGVGPPLTGTYRGHSLTLDTFGRRGSDPSGATYMRIVILVNKQANTYLALYEDGPFSKFLKDFGAEDVQIGDEEVDRRFKFKSRPANFAAALFMSVSFRSKLLQARSVNIEVDGRQLHFEQRGVEKDTDYLMFLFDLLSDLADLVERPQGGSLTSPSFGGAAGGDAGRAGEAGARRAVRQDRGGAVSGDGVVNSRWIPILGLLAAGGVSAVIRYARGRAGAKAWGELAGRTGLALEPGDWFYGVPGRITGTYRGRSLTLDTFWPQDIGRGTTMYTRIVILVDNHANTYLALYEEGMFSKVGKFFGAEDVQIGDEEVDRRFMIKSLPKNFAAALFTSVNFRSKLLQARSVNIEVGGRELYFEQRGVEKDTDYLVFLFDLLSDLADLVERPFGENLASP